MIVYCRNGNRSKTATKILNENGFNAYNMIVGMNSWGWEINLRWQIIKDLKNWIFL